MAAILNATTTNEVQSIMDAAAIVLPILEPHDAPFIYQGASWFVNPFATGRNSETVRWPREVSGAELDPAEMSYAVPKIEGDDDGYGDAILFELADTEAVGQMIGAKRTVTFRAGHVGQLDLQRVIRNTITIVQKRIARDQGIIGLGATNIHDLSGQALDRQSVGRAISIFRDQQPNGNIAAILTSGQIEQVKTDLRTDASSVVINDPGLKAFIEAGGSSVGSIEGVPVLRGEYQPNFDVSNDYGYLATVGEGGALGIGNYFAQDNPAERILGGFKFDLEWNADEDTWDLWVKAFLAHAITDEANFMGIASKKLLLAA